MLQCPFHGEDITMILRHEDVRKAAKDWQTFSSDAPFRVPIPSEEAVRTMRQPVSYTHLDVYKRQLLAYVLSGGDKTNAVFGKLAERNSLNLRL